MKRKALIFIIILFTICGLRFVIRFYLADIAYNRGDFRSAIALNPTEPIYYSRLGLELAQNNDPKAINYSDRAVSISPANLNILKERAQIFLYLTNLDKENYAKSIATLKTITQLAPTDAKIYWTIGQFLNVAGYSKEAIPFYQQAIILKENYDDAHFALGKIYFSLKQFDQAQLELEKTLKIAPNNSEAKALLCSLPQADTISLCSPLPDR
ncbi:MAG TPA: tetratricopeptide repeat protein [Candidatus Woesebacteria bacterium]|nr:tetratricopeptide repeat protein [Candidatus Woesebacteria bacterium]HRS22798.1 tetratricopeptide repeat protein [Candidatus Woesebacteria bacterium]HRT40306.1 tetratricopeptide repeat protein [Candidatus Woesebacteria bacterium]